MKLKGPEIVTTDLRLTEPSYASLPNIMKAKKKPIDDKSAADYGVDLTPRLEVLKTSEPPGRSVMNCGPFHSRATSPDSIFVNR